MPLLCFLQHAKGSWRIRVKIPVLNDHLRVGGGFLAKELHVGHYPQKSFTSNFPAQNVLNNVLDGIRLSCRHLRILVNISSRLSYSSPNVYIHSHQIGPRLHCDKMFSS
jgi:hypothetical protein